MEMDDHINYGEIISFGIHIGGLFFDFVRLLNIRQGRRKVTESRKKFEGDGINVSAYCCIIINNCF